MEKRSWFFQHFLQQRNDIQKQFYAYIETHACKFYSLIVLNSILFQHNILHIHLHSLNMHVLLQPVQKPLHRPSPVDQQLSLIIHLYATYNFPIEIKQLMQPHINYLVKIPSQVPNISSNKTTLQIPTSIPSVNSLPDWKNKYKKTQPTS